MNAPLVVFGEDWGSHPSSTQHLVRHLRMDRPVVWVNSIGMRRPRLTRHDVERAMAKLGGALHAASFSAREGNQSPKAGRPSACGESFIQVSPLALPAPRGRPARALNRWLLGTTVRRALAAAQLRRPVLWLSLPTAVDIVGTLGERSVVYYVGDDWGSMPGIDHEPVSRQEEELSAKADLILAASPVIAGKFPAAKTVVLLHGVDVKTFSDAGTPRAADLPAHPPVAGFYGTLSDWMDTELLAHAARSLPDWRLVLVGPEQTELAALKKLPNVVMMGPRRHDQLPSYVRHWDVSLLPFRQNAMTSAFNPLKLREYLAAGTPIVSTDFPALDGYRDLVEVAGTRDAFVAAMLRAREEGRRREQDRTRRVAAETWEARARRVSDLLGQIGAPRSTRDPAQDRP